MKIRQTLNLVKKNFYFAMVIVALLFIAAFVIAAYDATKASHGTLYTDRIEPKSQTDNTIEIDANIDILGLLVNGQPFVAGYWAESGGNVYRTTGNVGIGATSPSEKLEVNGNIKASGTICDSNGCIGGSGEWPDGSYCIFRSGGTCPPGFVDDTINLDIGSHAHDLCPGDEVAGDSTFKGSGFCVVRIRMCCK